MKDKFPVTLSGFPKPPSRNYAGSHFLMSHSLACGRKRVFAALEPLLRHQGPWGVGPLGDGVALETVGDLQSQVIWNIGKICLLPLSSSSRAITVIMHIHKYISLILMQIFFDSDI